MNINITIHCLLVYFSFLNFFFFQIDKAHNSISNRITYLKTDIKFFDLKYFFQND